MILKDVLLENNLEFSEKGVDVFNKAIATYYSNLKNLDEYTVDKYCTIFKYIDLPDKDALAILKLAAKFSKLWYLE